MTRFVVHANLRLLKCSATIVVIVVVGRRVVAIIV